MKYDEKGNLVKVGSTNRDDENMSYYSDSNMLKSYSGNGTSYTYDDVCKHQLKSASDGVVTQSMEYDEVGNVFSTTISGGGLSIKTTAEYTNNGNLLSSYTSANGDKVSCVYSDAKHLEELPKMPLQESLN